MRRLEKLFISIVQTFYIIGTIVLERYKEITVVSLFLTALMLSWYMGYGTTEIVKDSNDVLSVRIQLLESNKASVEAMNDDLFDLVEDQRILIQDKSEEINSLAADHTDHVNQLVSAAVGDVEIIEFDLTAYCSCSVCCGEWADGKTFIGSTATAGRTIAVDPKVIPLGSTVYIEGLGLYTAEDIGGAIDDHHIDIYFDTHQEALEFGRQLANVIIVKEGGK